VTRLLGCYLPTAKNRLVEQHYNELGFSPVERDGRHLDGLEIEGHTPADIFMTIVEG
jgi:predicted enzyme involved in methoxymalonyl-ACP biosynthesis